MMNIIRSSSILMLATATCDAFLSPPAHVAIAGRYSNANRISPSSPLSMTASLETSNSAADSNAEGENSEESPEPILLELRNAAMKLHTREQSPKEGEAAAPKREPYSPTVADYLKFLVDSQCVFEALEEAVHSTPDLMARFGKTGLERTEGLEKDVQFLCEEYGLERPEVGEAGSAYAAVIREKLKKDEEGDSTDMDGIPAFMCHYYNFNFAHTSGGRMIGKQMSKKLIDGKTLEFYTWEGDLNQIKDTVKGDIEKLASTWTRDQRDRCIAETPATFRGGGAINGYLFGGGGH